MEKLYDRIDWHNNTTPAINETNLNKMSKALDDLDDRVILIAGDILVTVPELREMLEDCTELEQRLEAMTENPPYIGENGHWYIWDTDTGAYVDSGIDASITVEIADITMLEPNATPYVTNTGTDTDPIFHLFIPRGQPGKGISSIAKTGTSGYVDTYTITYTDNTSTTYTVTNGRNTDQMPSIPTASASLVGTIYQYVGASTSSYTHGFYYECVNDGGTYKWVNIPVGNDPVEVSNTDPYTYRQGKGNLADMEIVGASVGWNQLVQSADTSVTVQSGHKYYANINGVKTVGLSNGTAITINDGTKDNIVDLTQLFGSTVADAIYAMETAQAGAGVAFFRKYFPKDYYAYDAGSIQSVCVGSRKVVGKNQWNEQTESGYYNQTGKASGSGWKRSNDYIKVVGGQTYTLSGEIVTSGNYTSNGIVYYTNDGEYISVDTYNITAKTFSKTFTTPSNCGKIGIYVRSNVDFVSAQLEFGSTATSYEPYTSTTYPFDSTKELRGMFSLVGGELKANGDIYKADGNIQRNWDILSNQTGAIGDTITLTGLKTNGNIICSAGLISEVGTISGTTLTLTKAISGADFVYEKATPTTESAQPYQNPQRAYLDGTEEFIDGQTRDVMIPVGNNTTYQQDKVLPSVEDYVDAVAEVVKADILTTTNEEENVNLDTLTTPGMYFVKNSDAGNYNYPSPLTSGVLTVIHYKQSGESMIRQELQSANYLCYRNGMWLNGSWVFGAGWFVFTGT